MSVTPHELRRYHAGELSAERRAEIEAALATDAALQARLDDLKADDAAFKASMPFERFVADHQARVEATASTAARLAAWWQRLALFGGAGALVAAAALVVAVNLSGPPSPEDALQTKGGVEGEQRGIGYFVEEQNGVRVGHEGDVFVQGDRIQFAVRDAPDAAAMVIVGVDGKGAVTTYAAQALASTREKGVFGKPRVLGESVVLDDAVGAERFFVVYGAGPVDALQRDVEAAARALAAARADLAATRTLPIDDARVVQSSVHIVKVPR